MLNIFSLSNGRLVQEEIESLEELAQFQPIWVDLESPTRDEKLWVSQYYGLSIPEDATDEDIEESARFYEEDNGELHIRSDFLIDDHDEPRSVRVAFILNLINPSLRSKGVLLQGLRCALGCGLNVRKRACIQRPKLRFQVLNCGVGCAGIFGNLYKLVRNGRRNLVGNFNANIFVCHFLTLYLKILAHLAAN